MDPVAKVCALTAMVFLVSSCGVFDPYVKHRTKTGGATAGSRAIPKCWEKIDPSEAVLYACEMLRVMERNRSGITTTQSGMVATLVPLSGIIGYNSARGINAPTNAAMAAGGLSLYAVGTSLAQSDRILIFDAGIRSVTCALTTYKEAANDGSAEKRRTLRELVRILQERVDATGVSDPSVLEIEMYLAVVNAAAQGDTEMEAKKRLETMMLTSVTRTVNTVNEKLTLTLPSVPKVLESEVLSWGTPKAQKPSNATTAAAGRALSYGRSNREAEVSALKQAVALIDAIYRSLEAPQEAIFSTCDFKLATEVGADYAPARLMLGAGDGMNGQVLPMSPGGSQDVRLFGGLAPFEKAVTQGQPPTPTLTFKEVSGAVFLTVTAPPGSAGDYVVIVGDASGQAKRFTVRVTQ